MFWLICTNEFHIIWSFRFNTHSSSKLIGFVFLYFVLCSFRRFWNWTVQRRRSNAMNPKWELFVVQTIKLMQLDVIWCVHNVPVTKWIWNIVAHAKVIPFPFPFRSIQFQIDFSSTHNHWCHVDIHIKRSLNFLPIILAYYSYTECLETRTYAIAHRSSNHKKFVPRCRSDGTYAAVQCMGGAGCWCSDVSGKPIPNTTTTSGKPICPKIGKVNMRRSPPPPSHSVSRARNRNRICRRNDQRLFNSNLLKSFHAEYSRAHPASGLSTDKAVLDWKFNQLDVNKDEQIHKFELREMRRLVRKVRLKLVDFWTLTRFHLMKIHFQCWLGCEAKTVRPLIW